MANKKRTSTHPAAPPADNSSDLPLPHERDQGADDKDDDDDEKPRRVIEQAKRDLDRGLEDTDCYGSANRERK